MVQDTKLKTQDVSTCTFPKYGDVFIRDPETKDGFTLDPKRIPNCNELPRQKS